MRLFGLSCLSFLFACGSTPVVFPGDATSRVCGAAASCAAPLSCDSSGECAECASDANCGGSTPACDPATKRCVPCRGSLGCSAPYVCSPSAPVCVLPCVDGNGCPGFIEGCKSSVCSACNEPDDCAPGTFCDRPHGRCVACLSSADCGAKAPVCNQGTGRCEACVTNLDCAGGAVCFKGACRNSY